VTARSGVSRGQVIFASSCLGEELLLVLIHY